MKVENEIQFAHVAKVAIQHLDEVVNGVQHYKLVVIFFNYCREVQTSVPLENKFILAPLKEVR